MKVLSKSFLLLLAIGCVAQAAPPSRDIEFKDGTLVYNADERGNRIPDFSYAGYAAGERDIPTVAAKLTVGAPAEDNTRQLQAAIDQVGKLDEDSSGFRGAVLIPPGEYKIKGSLALNVSGVVLRGSGAGEGGTTLLATGTDRRTVLKVHGSPSKTVSEPQPVTDRYVPVNATAVSVVDASIFRAGDSVRITHPSTKEWIVALGMDDLGGDRHGPSWRPGSRDLHWTRVITKIEGNTVMLDVPLTMALDASLAVATVTKLDASPLVRGVGIENLRIVSAFDPQNPKDEDHAWIGIGIENARDVWVRRVTCENLAGSAVAVWETSSRITIEDCKNLNPVGEIGAWRRNSFYTSGQQVLFQRCFSEEGWHDFAIGATAPGPNAFVQCEAFGSHGESGVIGSAASGTLFDRVRIDGQSLSLRNRRYEAQGAGWTSFNGVLWNSSAAVIKNDKPPAAQNWAFGTHGEFSGDGAWGSSDDDVNPDSLYYAQLQERTGKDMRERLALLQPPVQGSRAPTLESAAEAIEISKRPRVTMSQWIDEQSSNHPLPINPAGLPTAAAPDPSAPAEQPSNRLAVENGWLTLGGKLAVGRQMSVPWWRGGLTLDDQAKAEPALTRFVPGREGPGLTDDLTMVAQRMVADGQVSVWQHPPLWYERRRDDHSRVRRADAEVVAPFYETPWARSGQGRAYDGLSKWDVTKSNPWYFARLREFADLGARHGLVLFNGLYMQHSVLEAGAHYADAPWRSANNINPVGIPEPVFYAGDKLIYVAEQFYDVSNPERAGLHRAYMRNVLNELADKPNVILFLSEEDTGPVAFTQFWLDVVDEWKRETGKDVKVALYATKDVTDAILSDEKRSDVVSMIYSRFNNDGDTGWWYQADGTLYAPEGGKNLSPRQWSRLLKPKRAGFEQVHRAVREYRLKFPEKPFVYDGPDELAWAVVLGGGSLAPLPRTTDLTLLEALKAMGPLEDRVGLRDGAGNELVYSDQKPAGDNVRGIDMKTGQITTNDTKLYWIQAK